MFNELEFKTKREEIMKNLEILDSLVKMNQLQLKTLYWYKEKSVSGELNESGAQIALDDITSYTNKRRCELSVKLINHLE